MIAAISTILILAGSGILAYGAYCAGKAEVHSQYASEWSRIEREWEDIHKARKMDAERIQTKKVIPWFKENYRG